MKKLLSVLLLAALIFCETVPAFANHESAAAGLTSTIVESGGGTGTTYGYIDTEGNLYMWGSNQSGCAGQPTSISKVEEPTKVMTSVAAFKTFGHSTIAVKTDGTAWTWGFDYNHGVEYINTTNINNIYYGNGPEPYKVADQVAAVSLGNQNQFGILKTDGSVYSWGYNLWGGLGYDPVTLKMPDYYFYPAGFPEDCPKKFNSSVITIPYKFMDGAKAIAMGHHDGFALKKNGELWYWGSDAWIDGNPLSDKYYPPMKILDNVSSFTVGSACVAAILNNGQLWAWGHDGVGLYTWTNFSKRKKIADNVKAAFIENGLDDLKYVKANGDLYADGGKTFVMDHVAAITESLILKTDGTLYQRRKNNETNQYEITYIASNVAMPGQPFSSLRKKIGGFNDVREGDWFAAPVEWAVTRSITAGTTPTTFSPNQTCTTAQILTFLWVAAGQNQPKGDNPFTDVSEAAYFYRPALWAAENGLVEGAVFGGDTPCTRAAVVTYLWKLDGSPETAVSSQFTDVAADAEYAQAVAWAVKEGVTAGLSASTFGPDQVCTRAQIVTFLKAALD